MNTVLTKATQDVLGEYERANAKFPSLNSAHEGFAVLAEEVDELWDEVKTNPNKHPAAIPGDTEYNFRKHKERLRGEAIQVAAMALRFITDLT